MEGLHSCVLIDEITQYKIPTVAGDNFIDLLKHEECDKVAEEMKLEVKKECAKEEVEDAIISVKGNKSSEEFAERENEEERSLEERISRACAVQALGLPPEDDDEPMYRWKIKERPFKVARGPPSTALKRFQARFKKFIGMK